VLEEQGVDGFHVVAHQGIQTETGSQEWTLAPKHSDNETNGVSCGTEDEGHQQEG